MILIKILNFTNFDVRENYIILNEGEYRVD